MRTVIERDAQGEVNLVVDGEDTSPEAVVREYIKARDLLFPAKVDVKVESKVIRKEATGGNKAS